MPFLVLLLLALAGGTLAAFLASRYPTPVIGQEPSEAASELLAEETVKRPWLRRTLARRVDPQTATGLALTLALGLAIVGGLLVGVLAFLMRSSATLVSVDNSAGEWGVRPRDTVVDARDPARDRSRGNLVGDRLRGRRLRGRVRARAEPVDSASSS